MKNLIHHHSVFYRKALLPCGLLLVLLLIGCSESAPLLDTTKMTSPLGKKGACDHCQKEIGKVTEEHFVTVRGNRYIICDEKCEVDFKDWLSKQ